MRFSSMFHFISSLRRRHFATDVIFFIAIIYLCAFPSFRILSAFSIHWHIYYFSFELISFSSFSLYTSFEELIFLHYLILHYISHFFDFFEWRKCPATPRQATLHIESLTEEGEWLTECCWDADTCFIYVYYILYIWHELYFSILLLRYFIQEAITCAALKNIRHIFEISLHYEITFSACLELLSP